MFRDTTSKRSCLGSDHGSVCPGFRGSPAAWQPQLRRCADEHQRSLASFRASPGPDGPVRLHPDRSFPFLVVCDPRCQRLGQHQHHHHRHPALVGGRLAALLPRCWSADELARQAGPLAQDQSLLGCHHLDDRGGVGLHRLHRSPSLAQKRPARSNLLGQCLSVGTFLFV